MNFDFLTDKIFFPTLTYERFSNTRCVNFVYSSLFIQFFNVLLRFGAGGATAEELRTCLRQLDIDSDIIKSNVRRQIASIVGHGEIPTLRFINRMYISNQHRIKEEFKTLAAEFFKVNIASIDFTDNANATRSINDQVLNDTRMQTRDVMKEHEIAPDTKMVLISAASYKIRWRKPFPTDQIYEKIFHAEEDDFKIDFLHAVNHYKYYESVELGVDMVELTLENSGCMVVILPKETHDIYGIEKKIKEVFSVPLSEFKEDLVRVEIPKFKIITRINYKNILVNCGVSKMFNRYEADLCGISDDSTELSVDWYFQKMSFQIEDGGISSGDRFNPVEGSSSDDDFFSQNAAKSFLVDRPFIFYVKYWDHIIFGGKVEDPTYYRRHSVHSNPAPGPSSHYWEY